MSDTARFQYAQARLQARHGERPDEVVWRRLQSIGDLSNYLQVARQTQLRPWIAGMHSRHSSHEIELALRRQFRGYVDEVAHWLPLRWRDPVRLLRRLPDLPALQHLMLGMTAHPWMLDDPELRPFASENLTMRRDAMLNSDCAWLVQAWSEGQPLFEDWRKYWYSKWPGTPRLATGMGQLGKLLETHVRALREAADTPVNKRREVLKRKLESAFRRYSCQPAATFSHLALIALDLEKLRGELISRLLFAQTPALTQ